MKKLTFAILFSGLSMFCFSQEVIIEKLTAGNLSASISEKPENITSLVIVQGTMNAVDFALIQKQMPNIKELNIKGVNIEEYTGTEGTQQGSELTYPANTLPIASFIDKTSLVNINFPSSLVGIDDECFNGCITLGTDRTLVLPISVQTIGKNAFRKCFNITSFTSYGVKSIGDGAFSSCGASEYIFGPSLSKLGKNIFYQDTPSFIYCLAPDPPAVDGNLGLSTPEVTRLFTPRNAVSSYANHSSWSVIPSIDNSPLAFIAVNEPGKLDEFLHSSGYEETDITNFVVSGLLNTDDLNFLRKMPLEQLNMSSVEAINSIPVLAKEAIAYQTKLHTFTFPSNLLYIDANAFYGDNSLTLFKGLDPLNPCTVNPDAFNGIQYPSQVTLENVNTSIYQSTDYWNVFFKNMPTLLKNTTTSQIYGDQEGNVYLNNISPGSIVRIYTTNGKLIRMQPSSGKTLQFHLPCTGVYIFDIDGKKSKVIL